jgi:SHS2 domain-containing protein
MPYRFMEDIAIADVAFEAWGRSREDMFQSAADALLNVMVAETETVLESEEVHIRLENRDLEMLLFDFLGEIVFIKDSRLLLLRIKSATIDLIGESYTLTAVARGERIDPDRHPLTVDVKAVTLHRFKVEETVEGWRCEVVLDI